jgi:hypothetical protein
MERILGFGSRIAIPAAILLAGAQRYTFTFPDELIEVQYTMFEVEQEPSSSIVFQVLKKMSLKRAPIFSFHGSKKLSFSTYERNLEISRRRPEARICRWLV